MKGIVFGHLNVCSVIGKIEDVSISLSKSDIDFLFCSETFLNSSIDTAELQIDGYGCVRAGRCNREEKIGGGGLMLYYANTYEISYISVSCSKKLESLWVTFRLPKANPIELCGLYRPPDTTV